MWNPTIRSLIPGAIFTIGLLVAVSFKFMGQGGQGLSLVVGIFCLAGFLLPYVWLATSTLQENLTTRLEKYPLAIFAAVAYVGLLYLAYVGAADMGTGFGVASLVFYFVVPACIMYSRPSYQDQPGLCWRDVFVILAVWVPVDLEWVQQAWPWPGGAGGNIYTIPMAVAWVVVLFVCFKKLTDVGFRFSFNKKDLKVTLGNYLAFLVFAIPVGIYIEFIAWSGKPVVPVALLGGFVATFFLVAVPEELLFRGIMQNLLQRSMKNKHLALMIASLIFGLAHLNNGPSPDWRYAFLATVAGYFYGRSYNASKSLLPAVLVHTMVDVLWVHFFR